MKNIVFIIHELGIGGAERVATVVCNYLIQQGYIVNVVRHTNNFDDYTINGANEIYTLPYSRFKLVRVVKRLFAFLNFCRRTKADTVITLGIGDYMTNAFKKLNMGELILSQRNDPVAEYSYYKKKKKAIKSFNCADRIVFQTEQAKNYFPIEIQNKGIVIPNPIKDHLPKRFEGKRNKVVVNFCRLEEQKNLPLLIDAFRNFHESHSDHSLVIYGRGTQKEMLLNYIVHLKAEDFIKINDFIPNIHEVVRNAAMFVSSSDYEGISNSMIEAMGIGLPVICTDCPAGGASMMIQNGINGLLVPVRDKESLCHAMCMLAENNELTERLSLNASKITGKLNSESICEKWMEIIGC